MRAIRLVAGFMVLAFCLAVAGIPGAGAEEKYFKVGDVVPAIMVKDLEGKEMDIRPTMNKENNLLVFFNTSCTLCMQELESIDKAISGKTMDKVSVVAIGVDIGGPPVLKRFVDQVKHGFPVYSNQTFSVPLSFGFSFTPSSVILDKEGKVVTLLPGYTPEGKMKVEALFQ